MISRDFVLTWAHNIMTYISMFRVMFSSIVMICVMYAPLHPEALELRHNGRDSVSNHQPHDCLLNRLFRRTSKKTSKLCITGLCAGNSSVPGEFPAQMASNAENVSIWWRHHERNHWSHVAEVYLTLPTEHETKRILSRNVLVYHILSLRIWNKIYAIVLKNMDVSVKNMDVSAPMDVCYWPSVLFLLVF